MLAIECCSIEKWQEFISNIDDERLSLIVKILYYTGCSESDLINLKINDIILSQNIIKFGKRKSFLPGNIINDIEKYSKEISQNNTFLFQGRSGPISAKRLQQLINEISAKFFGEKISPQSIRLIHVIHALSKNVSVASISKQSGLSYQRIAQIMEKSKEDLEKKSYRYEL